MSSLQALKDQRVKAFSDKLKSENDAIYQKYAKLKKFVKDQKKRTKKVSKKHEWTQRKSRLQQDTEDAENDLLAHCRLLADDKDPQFADVFVETLTSYESQESAVKILSHKVNGILIAFLSAKNYMLSMLDSMHSSGVDESGSEPLEVFFNDIRSTYLSVMEEIGALVEEEETLDQFIKKYSPNQADGNSSTHDHLPSCQQVLKELLSKYVLAEAHVKEAVRLEFEKLETLLERKVRTMGSSIYKPGGTPLPKLSQSKSKKRVPGQVSSSFMRARNEAAKTAQSKGRKALLKEISEILPHIKYSTLERQNEQFQQQQQQRIRNKEFVELHKREMKRLVKASEEKLALSSDEARKKACNAAACLEWEVHADVYAQHLKHYQKERALDDEIQGYIRKEEEEKKRIERERQEEAERKEREHQRQRLAVYRDAIGRKRLAEYEAERMRKLEEEQQRAMLLVETEKRVKYRQQLDSMRNAERQAKEELIKEELRAKEFRLERLASSVAPEIEADPARARAHTYASASMLTDEHDGDGTAFNPVHGYFDDRLFQDQRFRIGEALRAAGLHATNYGRQVLTDIKSNVPHRNDMRTTVQKMANR